MLQAAPTRGKRRNVEKRREKSRCAARSRREKEAGIFTDLYVTVPIVSESTITHVDRIAVLRLAATLCRVRRVAEKVFPPPVKVDRSEPSELFAEASINECLDGFLTVIDSTGLIIYISPNCSRSLGLTQTDLIGQNLHDYLHSDDSASLEPNLNDAAFDRVHALLRMKSVLSPRGRNLTLKSAIYKPVLFAVSKTVVEFPPIQLQHQTPPRPSPGGEGAAAFPTGDVSDFEDDDDGCGSADNAPVTELDSTYFVMHGLPLILCGAGAMGDYHGPGTFMTRHTMDMKFSYCHERLTDYLGYDSKSLMNSSFFALVHPEDVSSLTTSLKELYRKGHVSTGYYRLMVKSGGHIWVTTAGNTVTHSARGHGGQYIVCVHQLISGGDSVEITADVQQTAPSLLSKMETERKIKHSKVVGPSTEQLLQRAPTVSDYIPLTNPNASVSALGLASPSINSVTSKSRTESGNDCHQAWLFRAVGGTESCDTIQRGSGERANAVSGTAAACAHVDAAARNCSTTNSSQKAMSNEFSDTNTTTDASVLVSTTGSFDPIPQADIERVLFAPMPVASVHAAPAVAGGTTVGSSSTNAQTKVDDLSSLAPFIHTDEILSLDFGQSDVGLARLSPSLIDGLELDFDSVTDYSHGALYMLEESALGANRPLPVERSAPDMTVDKVKIESIYRYLRDEGDDVHNGMGTGAETLGLPPLLIVESGGDQKCPSLISPWQYQATTPPYGLPAQHHSPLSMFNGHQQSIAPQYPSVTGSVGGVSCGPAFVGSKHTKNDAQQSPISGRMINRVGGQHYV